MAMLCLQALCHRENKDFLLKISYFIVFLCVSIGWSIVDWKSENKFNVIKSGVYSIKKLNDKDFNLKNKGYSSESNERKYISVKRNFETL